MGNQVGIPAIYQFAELSYQQVNTFADLPSAGASAGKVYLVLTTTGVWFVNRKRRGLWRSDGAVWVRMGIAPTKEDMGLGIADDVEFSKLKLGTNAFIKWIAGDLLLMSDEGTNANTRIKIKGKGIGYGEIYIYDDDDAEYFWISTQAGNAYLSVKGVSPGGLYLQHIVAQDIKCWSSIVSGNPYFYVYGFKAGDVARYGRFRVNSDGDLEIEAENNVIFPNLAGVGDRAVMVDVNGKLSAP